MILYLLDFLFHPERINGISMENCFMLSGKDSLNHGPFLCQWIFLMFPLQNVKKLSRPDFLQKNNRVKRSVKNGLYYEMFTKFKPERKSM